VPAAAEVGVDGHPWGWAVHLPAAALIAAYFGYFARLSVAVQDGYGTPGFDMGIFDQGVWLLSRFHAPFVTVMGRDLFGDHTSFVLLLAVPLFWIHPAAQTLLVLQAALIAGAGVPIYLLGRRLLASPVLATALTGAYLLNPALQHGNLEQFHPEAFLVLSIAIGVYAAVESRPVLLGVAVAASLLVKEDTAVLIVPLGAWVALRRDRAWGLRIVVAAVAYMAFAYEVVIRSLLGTISFYSNRIPFGGIGGLLSTAVEHPGRLATYLRSGGRPFYLWQLGCSTGWVWLLSPEIAAIGVLSFVENTVSNFPYMHEILFHYTLPLVPVLAMGTVWGISRLATPARRRVATGVATTSAIVCCAVWGLAPFSRNTYPHLDPASVAVRQINEVRAALPAGAVVSAYYGFVPHVDHRLRCYQWPTPFRAQYWDLYTEEGQRLPFAGQVQYLFLPTVLDASDQAVLDSVRADFRVVRTNAEATLWKRVAPRR
jgi:uncharacterized membrane protein